MRRSGFRIALYVLAGIHLAVLMAGFIAPYSASEQFRGEPYAAPTRLHFIDSSGDFHVRPFVIQQNETKTFAVPIKFFEHAAGYRLLGFIPANIHLFGSAPSAHVFLFGTDAYGRDQFSRFLYGGQISILVGLFATAVTVGAGSVLGTLAGFYGGWRDSLVMRASELFLSLPWIYLLLGIRAFLPLSLRPEKMILLLAGIIGLLGWARPARVVRGVVRSAANLAYVSTARQFGAPDLYLVRRHILPDAYGVILTQSAILIPQYIAAEVTLSFLGLGVSEPLPSWGTMLASMREITVVASYWWMSLPALALIPLFFCYQLAAQGIQQTTVKKG